MSQSTLNKITTIVGLFAGGSALLGGAGIINPTVATTISGIATAVLGYFVHQPTADQQPTQKQS
ncbi:hypothetical protein I8752_29175 [Nostocaceae cyanobacterium CENA369]|uniref:Uncharacterized protein n=1 Tax=Dendronalium phyllosphericum CENA369 TaxID=1725256 RepID=A0A8J7LGF3_9NOST|nr:hypothetical protein [Dendronalium phyllosphericum]MBH8576982.1 hypothetical protein [Dendronalium phyllosphericum CENA369]